MLLRDAPPDAEAFVAIDGRHELVIGAAIMTQALRASERPGPGVAVHVIPPCRGAGVGRKLLQEVLSQAILRRARALYAINRAEFDSAEMHAWQWLGFSACETIEEHELEIAAVEHRLAPLIERMKADGRIPADASIAPLYKADPAAVAQLHVRNLGGDVEAIRQRVEGKGPHPFFRRHSLVLTLGGDVVGCLLGHRLSERAFVIDAVIVDPPLRNGWANLLLRCEAAQRVKHEGASHIQYTSFDHYTDTRRFTQKLGGVTLRRFALMYRPID